MSRRKIKIIAILSMIMLLGGLNPTVLLALRIQRKPLKLQITKRQNRKSFQKRQLLKLKPKTKLRWWLKLYPQK